MIEDNKYKRIMMHLDKEMADLDSCITKNGGISPTTARQLYFTAKTAVKVAKMEDIMMHLWKTGRLSGHPHEDGHYEHDHKTPAPGTMPR